MSRNRDIGLFFVIVVLFGSSFPAIKIGGEYFPPLLLATARYYLSALLLLTYAALTKPYWKPRIGNDWKAIIAGGVLFIGGTGLSFVGIQYTTSGVAAIIFSLIPVLTVLIGWLLLPTEGLSRPLARFVLCISTARPDLSKVWKELSAEYREWIHQLVNH